MPGGHGSTHPQDGVLRACFLRPFLRLFWHRLPHVRFHGKQTLNWKLIEEGSGGQGLPKGREESGSGQREELVCVAVTAHASANPTGLAGAEMVLHWGKGDRHLSPCIDQSQDASCHQKGDPLYGGGALNTPSISGSEGLSP